MKPQYKIYITTVTAVALLATTRLMGQSVAYSDPLGGWGYAYTGDAAAAGSGGTFFDSLDGNWNHSSGTGPGDSDNWDGSAIGGTLGSGNAPGGVELGSAGGTTYLRMQDPGNPVGYSAPYNNTMAFGRNLTGLVNDNFLNTGVTLSFRVRVPTDALDSRTLGGSPSPYPTLTGDGYGTFGNGLGAFYVKNSSGTGPSSGDGGIRPGAIGFGLSAAGDLYPTNGVGLVMNNRNGDVLLNNVDSGEAFVAENFLPLADATVWNEFWITIVGNDATPGNGTHTVSIYANGSLTPTVFNVTGGNNNQDYQQMASMGMALASNQGSGAMDVDFFAVKDGIWTPQAVPEPSVMGLTALGALALLGRYRGCRRN